MTEGASDPPTVLLVEDESATADAFVAVLESDYRVRVASEGQEALRRLTDDVDIVLLDRRLPDMSGDEVLQELQARNANVRVAMVTAVEPDFDIVGMGCDDYLVKPVGPDALRETVQRLVELNEYDETYLEYTSKQVKRNVLEVEKTRAELEQSEEFQRLQSDIEALEGELEAMEAEFDDELLRRNRE